MKTTIVSDSPARKLIKPRRRLSSRQRGVAIITVLAVIVLMSVLVLSFFEMSKSEAVSAKNNAEILRSYSLRDTAINLAIAQIREATAPTTANVNANALWTSQPGMIRTFDKAGNNGPIFKLYSAKQMVADGNASEDSMLQEDLSQNWNKSGSATRPNVENPVWVDINKPIFKTNNSVGSGASDTTISNLGTALYPIVDPAAYKKGRAPDDPVAPTAEGFFYEDVNKRLGASVDSEKSSLPMPVRWLYTLQDGTVGYLNDNNEFVAPATGGTGGTPSTDNPIVGRIAFWADDESCKININTASEGVFWDTPRCDTPEERFYANCQPAANEFQRYPGHPAGVCLSSVLFPNKRYYPKGDTTQSASGDYECEGGIANQVNKKMGRLKPSELRFIWDLAPFISDRTASGATKTAGTVGGLGAGDASGKIRRAVLSDATDKIDSLDTGAVNNPEDHIYTSSDEMIFRGKKKSLTDVNRYTWSETAAASSKTPSPYAPPLTEEQFQTRVSRNSFMLTTRSTSPEVSVFGHPRICLWPLDKDVPAIAGTTTGALGGKYTAFDSIIGLTTQLSPTNSYSVLRGDAGSRHYELRGQGGGQNLALWDYLRLATSTAVGKFPGVPGKATFLSKYKANAGNTIYSDRDNIMLGIIDYIRNTNLADPLLDPGQRYGTAGGGPNVFPGQITGFCGCPGSSGGHVTTWCAVTQPDPKGSGRTFAPIRMHWVVQKVGEVDNSGAWQGTLTANEYQAAAKDSAGQLVKNVSVYEMGIVVEGSCPSQGFAGIVPNATVFLGGGDPSGAQTSTAQQCPSLYLNEYYADAPTKLLSTNRKLTVERLSSSDSTKLWPKAVPNWGGVQGMRAYSSPDPVSTSNLIRFKPFAIRGQPTVLEFISDPAKPNEYTDWNKYLWRIMAFDARTSTDVNNLVQAFYFHFGKPYSLVKFPLSTTAASKTLAQQVAAMYAGGFNPTSFENASVHSMFIPHADYRTLNSRRVIGAANGYDGYSLTDGGLSGYSGKWNSFIPTKDFGKPQKYAFDAYDPVQGAFSGTSGVRVKSNHPSAPITGGQYELPINAVFDFPLPYEEWFPHLDPLQRKARGSMDPAITGDFDNGVAAGPDGSYAGRADEGDLRTFFTQSGDAQNTARIPYFGTIGTPDLGDPTPNMKAASTASTGINATASTPNRIVRSPVQLGSISSGALTNTYWQSLLFRPDAFGGNPAAPNSTTNNEWDNRHFGGALNTDNPRDHLLLDLFWMPVVQPYALSDTFSTKGKINMNYKIMPFEYIHRSTALHALLKAERILAIPTAAASVYKTKDAAYAGTDNVTGTPEPKSVWRKFIDAEATLWQFDRKFSGSKEFAPVGGQPPRVFRTASEICELWMIPESINHTGAPRLKADDNPFQLMRNFWMGINKSNDEARTWGGTSPDSKKTAIKDIPLGHRLTGDNTKESTYANLYPRLTTRSNVFKIHFTVQTLQKARSTPVNKFDPDLDLVTSESRGSAIVERALDMTNPNLQKINYLKDPSTFSDMKKRLDYFYSYRITEIKQFSP